MVLGGISSAVVLVVFLGMAFFMADRPPSSSTEVTERIFGAAWALVVMWPGFWFFLIGAGGLAIRRLCEIPKIQPVAPKTVAGKAGPWGQLFGDDYRVATWIMVIGAVWLGQFAMRVAPWFLESGRPPNYAWIGPPTRLPPVEHVVSDALIPLVSYAIMRSPGLWLMSAGAALALVQLARRRVQQN